MELTDGQINWSHGDGEHVTAEDVESYKREWAKRGFPDVERGSEIDSLNNPVYGETPEKLLWSCVLSEAFVDLERGRLPKPSKKYKAYAEEAQAWFASSRHDEGSFLWVCDVLGFEADYIRRKVTEGFSAARPGRRYTVVSNPHGCKPREAA